MLQVVSKLDESQVDWILREKRKLTSNKEIVETMGISVRWVQLLWARYKNANNVQYPYAMGRPIIGLPGRREHSAVLSVRATNHLAAKRIEDIIENQTGIHIPHNTIHKILLENDMAKEE